MTSVTFTLLHCVWQICFYLFKGNLAVVCEETLLRPWLFILQWCKSILLEIEGSGLKTVLWCVFVFFFFLSWLENVVATCQNYTVSHHGFFKCIAFSFTISCYLLMKPDSLSGKTYQFSKNYTASGKERHVKKGKALILVFFFAILALTAG